LQILKNKNKVEKILGLELVTFGAPVTRLVQPWLLLMSFSF